jgi:CMP-N-acetylneuraminic acid synthetase
MDKETTRNIIAIIPARGGSKGIPKKNIVKLDGKPLIEYSIAAALNSKLKMQVVVSTDCAEIAAVAKSLGAKVIMRPESISGDKALTIDAVEHAVTTCEAEQGATFSEILLLQPTSPLRTVADIEESHKLFDFRVNSVISVTEVEHHPYKDFVVKNGELEQLFDIESLSKPRQELPKIFRQNGAIYWVRRNVLFKSGSFYSQPCLPYVMPSERSIDIDNYSDINMAELLLKK